MTSKPKPPEVPEDFLALVRRIIGSAADDEPVKLKASWVRILLALAERAPQARRRPKRTLQQKRHEWLVLQKARNRKAELVKRGMYTELAAVQAAEEVSHELPNLSIETIVKRMRRRS
jgi:hypothetical protein